MKSSDKLYKRVVKLALATAAILLIPLVLTLTGSGVDGEGFHWKPDDFVFMGALIFSTGFAYILVTRKAGSIAYRFAVGVALLVAFLLVWTNAAVGLIGSGPHLGNLMYIGVLAVGIIGAVIAKFRPHGMQRAMFGMALSIVLLVVIALIMGMQHYPGSSVIEIIGANGFFIVLFAASAFLFGYAAQEKTPS